MSIPFERDQEQGDIVLSHRVARICLFTGTNYKVVMSSIDQSGSWDVWNRTLRCMQDGSALLKTIWGSALR